MGIDFKKFNQEFPAEQVKKQMKDAETNSGSDLPDGEYKIKLDKMELAQSQKGQLMIKAQFRIKAGNHQNKCIFVNKVMTGTKNDGFMMLKAKEFLESLDSGLDVEFNDWEQFNDLILDIADAIKDDDLTYICTLTTDNKYQNFEIIDVLD